ncbi:hypothetical protein FHS85_004534 [Rhodoligotrophos appendicifer]|uniref:hypothetical protein n=1 Tax=Rhodoligotrophos appendicifer TaxID=987056 RepID=UPI00118700C8|nr:hypothetical protein [Rhodoligotrophos appendicifer]
MPSLIYTAELLLDQEDREPFLQWYAYRHAPDLFPIGFQVCTCYQAVIGDMTFLDIYEIPEWEIFTGRPYARMAEKDVYAGEVLAKRRDKAHTLYQHRQLAPEGATTEVLADADWVSVLRFNSSLDAEDMQAALQAEASRLAADGATGVRFAERSRDHPVYTTHRPHYMLMAEWPERPSSEASLFDRLPQQLPGALSEITPFLGRRVYPWPNTRA